jgi:hypothetical protein
MSLGPASPLAYERAIRAHAPVSSGVVALFALVLLALVCQSREARAQPSSLSGRWSATPLTATWSIGDWGRACGPKPSGGGLPSSTVVVSDTGGELVINGNGRVYTTRECWEEYPGLARTSHTAGSRNWRTTCRTPATDPRQASLVTTVTASDNQIIFDEAGQYQFVIQGQNCTASVRRSRFFHRIATTPAADAGTPAPTSAPPAAVRSAAAKKEAPTGATRSSACASPGPPARIEVRPSRKLIRPGESFLFRATVVDAGGCALAITPTFRSVNGPPSVSVASSGRVEVSADAPEGDVQLVAVVGNRNVGVVLEVVSKERYDALLAEGGFDPSGASADTAVARLESGSVGARTTVVEDDSAQRRTIFVAVVGGAAVLLGLLGLALVRRGRHKASASRPAPLSPPRSSHSAKPERPMVCPTCREEYPAQAQFCPGDGNRLVPLESAGAVGPSGSVCPVCGQGYDPGVAVCPKHDEPLVPPAVYAAARARSAEQAHKICPVCGAQFVGDNQFCGKCGAALVQVN